jgi:hypothetical protein
MGFLDDLKNRAEVLGDTAKEGFDGATEPPPLAQPLGPDPMDPSAPDFSVPEPVSDAVRSDPTRTHPDADGSRPA